jgi:hypothetical protein
MEHMIGKRILDIGLFHNQIEAEVKVRKNSNRSIGCCHSRKIIIIVLRQLKNFERWTARVKYGSRRVAETDYILFYQKGVWRICFSKEVSKHGEGNGSESVII